MAEVNANLESVNILACHLASMASDAVIRIEVKPYLSHLDSPYSSSGSGMSSGQSQSGRSSISPMYFS